MEEEPAGRLDNDASHGVTEGLRKAEAASLLGMSPRALERYVKDGKLTVRYESGSTRPVAVYDRDEVTALAASRRSKDGAGERGSAAVAERYRFDVSLRLDAYYGERLASAAVARGLRPSDYAAHLLMAVLDDHREDALEEVREELRRLRENLAVATEGVLVALGAGEAISPDDARSWVEENLRGAEEYAPDAF